MPSGTLPSGDLRFFRPMEANQGVFHASALLPPAWLSTPWRFVCGRIAVCGVEAGWTSSPLPPLSEQICPTATARDGGQPRVWVWVGAVELSCVASKAKNVGLGCEATTSVPPSELQVCSDSLPLNHAVVLAPTRFATALPTG